VKTTALNTRDGLIGLAETAQHLEPALTIVAIVLIQRHQIPLAPQNKKLSLVVYHTIVGPSNRPGRLGGPNEAGRA